MTVGHLRKLIEPLDDDLDTIVVGPVTDEDGDEAEAWFAVRDVTREMDHDTGEDYARFACVRLEDLQPHDGD
jgi:hypothetical protein